MAGEIWNEKELIAAVIAYRVMQILEEEGKKFTKAKIYTRLASDFNRTPTSFRRRMHNISSVLQSKDEGWISSLQPLSAVGSHKRVEIATILSHFDKPTIRLMLELYDLGYFQTDL